MMNSQGRKENTESKVRESVAKANIRNVVCRKQSVEHLGRERN